MPFESALALIELSAEFGYTTKQKVDQGMRRKHAERIALLCGGAKKCVWNSYTHSDRKPQGTWPRLARGMRTTRGMTHGSLCGSWPILVTSREAWYIPYISIGSLDHGIGHAADQGPCGAIDTPPLLLSHCLHHEHTVSFIASRHKSTRPFWNASGFRCGGPWASPGGSWGQTPCSRGRSRYDSVYSATAVSFSSRPIPGFSGKGRRPCRATGGWR